MEKINPEKIIDKLKILIKIIGEEENGRTKLTSAPHTPDRIIR